MYAIVKNCFRRDLEDSYIKEFTDNHLLLLIYMQKYKNYQGQINFTLGWLFDDLEINYSMQKELINCFSDLIDWDIISLVNVINKVNKNTRLQVELNNYTNGFTQILLSEFDKIFNLDVDIRTKKTMLFLYCDIVSRIDSKGYCFPSFESFKMDLNTTSDNRINDALKLLQNNNLIAYGNVGQILVDGKVQQGNNVYVLTITENYEQVLQKGIANRKKDYLEGKAKIKKGAKSNKQRSIKQRLNNLWKKYNNGSITDEEITDLKKLELEYYELIKLDTDKVDEIEFIFLDEMIELEKTKALEKELEEQEVGHFGTPKNNKSAISESDIDINKIAIQYAKDNNYSVDSIYAYLDDIEDYLKSDDFLELSKVEKEEILLESFDLYF